MSRQDRCSASHRSRPVDRPGPDGRPIRRHAQRDLRDARDARGDRGHQDGRRIHRSSTRDVTTRAVDGHGDGAHDDAVALVAGLGGALTRVEVGDAFRGSLDRVAQRRRNGFALARRSATGTRRSSRTTPSNRSVSSRSAASPRCLTAARISRTAATGASAAIEGRGSWERRSPVKPRRSSTESMSKDQGTGRPWTVREEISARLPA